jgi:hypothetical protein
LKKENGIIDKFIDYLSNLNWIFKFQNKKD